MTVVRGRSVEISADAYTYPEIVEATREAAARSLCHQVGLPEDTMVTWLDDLPFRYVVDQDDPELVSRKLCSLKDAQFINMNCEVYTDA